MADHSFSLVQTMLRQIESFIARFNNIYIFMERAERTTIGYLARVLVSIYTDIIARFFSEHITVEY